MDQAERPDRRGKRRPPHRRRHRRAARRAVLTSSTPPAPPGGRRAWPSAIPASATSSGSRPRLRVSPAADRVYQGLTMAFDFSVEEIWVPWLAGATLVPEAAAAATCSAPTSAGFLREQPDHRAVLRAHAAGHAGRRTCPGCGSCSSPAKPARASSSHRWHRPGRRFLNVYGPTEATVSATWTLLEPGLPVTIGVPLPTYSVVDPRPAVQPWRCRRAASARSAIAGIGLAEGYLNLPDLTEQAFMPDFARHAAATPRGGSTAPATSAGSTPTARSSTSAASTPRSRSAVTASS